MRRIVEPMAAFGTIQEKNLGGVLNNIPHIPMIIWSLNRFLRKGPVSSGVPGPPMFSITMPVFTFFSEATAEVESHDRRSTEYESEAVLPPPRASGTRVRKMLCGRV
jgi:hypothetical protein